MKQIPELSIERRIKFWNRINIKGVDDCWEWKLYRDPLGYGRQTFTEGSFLAHRIAYFLSTGENPGEYLVCHSCDNPPCCNPKHLWLGTNKDNNNDAIEKKRMFPIWEIIGEANNKSKLTAEIVREIRKSPLRSSVLARTYKVSDSAVCDIRKYKNWAHV